MPDGHELPHRDMTHHPDPFDKVERERSEMDSLASNPYNPSSSRIYYANDMWIAWREGWLERKKWDEERDARKKRGK